MIPNKEYENIERFLNEEMSPDEIVIFQKKLAEDKQLASTLALYQDVPKHLEDIQGNLNFNAELTAAAQKYKTKNNKKTPSKRNTFIIVAIIIALLLGVFGWQKLTKEKQQIPADVPMASLWENTVKPTANIQRSGAQDLDISKYQNAYNLYDLGDYPQALATLDSIQSDSDIYSETLLLKGVVQYENQEYGASIHTFDTYLLLGSIEDLALWYQSFAYIKNKQQDAARKNLQKIIDNDYSQAEKAKALIKQL